MKTVLVTGGSRGIGLEFCKQYLKKGYQVVVASRNPEKSHELEQLKAQRKHHLVILKQDVGDEESRSNFYEALSAKTGKLDVLINCAGIISGNEQFCYPFGRLKQEDLCRIILINSEAPLMMVEKVRPMLVKGSRQLVVNITSYNGSITRKSSRVKYGNSATKAALNIITKILSIELRKHEIFVVSLHPG